MSCLVILFSSSNPNIPFIIFLTGVFPIFPVLITVFGNSKKSRIVSIFISVNLIVFMCFLFICFQISSALPLKSISSSIPGFSSKYFSYSAFASSPRSPANTFSFSDSSASLTLSLFSSAICQVIFFFSSNPNIPFIISLTRVPLIVPILIFVNDNSKKSWIVFT